MNWGKFSNEKTFFFENYFPIFIEEPEGSLDYCVESRPRFWQEDGICHCTWNSKILVCLIMQSMLERRSKKTILHVQMILFPYQELQVYHPTESAFPKSHNLLKDEQIFFLVLSKVPNYVVTDHVRKFLI